MTSSLFCFAEKIDCRSQHVSGRVLSDSTIFRAGAGYTEGIQKANAQDFPEVSLNIAFSDLDLIELMNFIFA